MSTFEQLNLNAHVLKAITTCGYTTPTTIQSRSIPYIISGKDIVASAQTGTGKTAAFVLPALDRLASSPSKGKPRILILTPTRELATQINDAVARYGKYLQPNIVSLLGGMPYHKQLKALSRQVDIIVATPGRLLDHIERGRVDLSCIEMLILDEADRMLDMGFIDEVSAIANKTPKTRQTLLFSATVDGKLSQVVRNLLIDPVRIDLANEKLTPTKIKQELYYADNPQHKMRLLMHMLANENIFKAIIFSATKINADRLAKELCDNDYPALPLHGDLKQNMRNKTVEQLRRGKVQFVVATDVASRGIDISDITHVINFDLPRFSEDYVHRIGRTGRAGKEGIAISLALSSDARHLSNIERYIGQKLSASTIPGLEPTKRAKGFSDNGGSSKKRSFKSGAPERSSRSDDRYGKDNKSKSFKSSSRSNNDGLKYSSAKPGRFKSEARDSYDKRDAGPSRFKSDARSGSDNRRDAGGTSSRFKPDARSDRRDSGTADRFKSDTRSDNRGNRRDASATDRFKTDTRSDSRGSRRDTGTADRFKETRSDSRGSRHDTETPNRFKSDRRNESTPSRFKSDTRFEGRDNRRDASTTSRFKPDTRSNSRRDSSAPNRFKSDARPERGATAGRFKSDTRTSDNKENSNRFKSDDRSAGRSKSYSKSEDRSFGGAAAKPKRFRSDSKATESKPSSFKPTAKISFKNKDNANFRR